jgi:hypothetical protein
MKPSMKASSLLQWRSNSFFSHRLIGLLIGGIVGLVAVEALAVNMAAVYSSTCQRDIGVVIDVDHKSIRLLSLDGQIRRIDRFNIIYVATYPVGDIPIARVANPESLEIVTIKTLHGDDVVDLVSGWMIDHSEHRLSFLTLDGVEVIVDVNDIWDIEFRPLQNEIAFSPGQSRSYHFVHPYPFMHCQAETTATTDVRLVYPQQLLADPFLIKKEFDRLKDGYDRLKGFNKDKRFYARPQIYGNDARLGVWANYGSRYGASRQRNNSFIPEIISEYSAGPYGFQHIIVTGNALMPSGVHEEPQMHVYYRLKADYVHFAIMVDINRYVIGESRYRWHPEDMEPYDHRDNDTLNVAGGFDYGAWAVDVSVWNRVQYGVRGDSVFHHGALALNKGGIFFQNRLVDVALYYGFGSDRKKEPLPLPDDASSPMSAYIDAYNRELAEKPEYQADYSMVRLNLDFRWLKKLSPAYSLIVRELVFHRQPDSSGTGEFRYRGLSLTNALQFQYVLDDEIRTAGYLSLERLENSYGIAALDSSDGRWFPKIGLNVALVF